MKFPLFVLLLLCVANRASFGLPAYARSPLAVTPPPGALTIRSTAAADDSVVIQKALDGLRPGEWLVFEPGVYNIATQILARVNGITLFGNGSTIHSTNAKVGGLMIQGDDVVVDGFTFTQASTSRQSTPWAGGISVYDARTGCCRRVQGSVIRNNVVDGAAAAGIFLDKASNFAVEYNHVYRSWADGIHMTGGATNGRVLQNTVSENGDDMIAVVSYAGSGTAPAKIKYADWAALQDDLDQNIYIGRNRVVGNYWGRGITVVGGSNVTIDSNFVSNTAVAAGIYLTREAGDSTFGDHNILVSNNVVTQIENNPAEYMPPGFIEVMTYQGAVEIGAQMTADEQADPTYFAAFSVSGIALTGNVIVDAAYGAIRLGIFSPADSVNQIRIQDNDLTEVGSNSVVMSYAGLKSATLACTANTLNGTAWPTRCATGIPPGAETVAITGAPAALAAAVTAPGAVVSSAASAASAAPVLSATMGRAWRW